MYLTKHESYLARISQQKKNVPNTSNLPRSQIYRMNLAMEDGLVKRLNTNRKAVPLLNLKVPSQHFIIALFRFDK